VAAIPAAWVDSLVAVRAPERGLTPGAHHTSVPARPPPADGAAGADGADADSRAHAGDARTPAVVDARSGERTGDADGAGPGGDPGRGGARLSRRTLLRGAATTVGSAAVGATAGCTTVLSDGEPDYAAWLYDPATVFRADRRAYASLDLAAVRADADRLPADVDDALSDLDREFRSVDVSSVDRLTALAYGRADRGRVAATVAATGEFDPGAVHREVTAGTVEQVDTHGGFRLYGYAPSFLADVDRFRPPDGDAPDVSLGLGTSDSALVAGAALATDVTALETVRASADAHAGDAPRYADEYRDGRDLLATLGDDAFVVGGSAALVADLRTRLPDAQADVRDVLSDVRGLGVSASLADERLSVALAADPTDLVSGDRLRRLLEDSGDGFEVDRVTVARDGRVVRADLAVTVEQVAEAYRNASVDPGEAFGGLTETATPTASESGS